MPSYDFEKHKIKNSLQFKVYCGVFLALMWFFWANSLMDRYNSMYCQLLLPHRVAILVYEITDPISFSFPFFNSIFQQNCWNKLLKKSTEIENLLNITTNKTKFYQNAVFIKFICFHGIMYFGNLTLFFLWRNNQPEYTSPSFIISAFSEYYVFVQLFTILNIFANIFSKYKELTNHFNATCSKAFIEDDFTKEIRKISKLFRETNELVRNFNSLFGLQIMMIVIGSAIMALTSLDFMSQFLWNVKLLKLSSSLIWTNLALTIFFIVIKLNRKLNFNFSVNFYFREGSPEFFFVAKW